jgi:hypothetical protein
MQREQWRDPKKKKTGKGKKAYLRWLTVLLVTVAVATTLLVVVEGYDGARCWLPLLRCVEAIASVFSFLFFSSSARRAAAGGGDGEEAQQWRCWVEGGQRWSFFFSFFLLYFSLLFFLFYSSVFLFFFFLSVFSSFPPQFFPIGLFLLFSCSLSRFCSPSASVFIGREGR